MVAQQTDVVVIGGGPAGSTVATLVAQQGYRVQLFERDYFPRFHIGESLIPETYWVLKRLGMLPKLRHSHFIKKYSVQFMNEQGRLSEPFYFWDHKPHECSQTWQVRRSEFDTLLLENSQEHGATVHQGARVLEVLFEAARAYGVRVQFEDGTQQEVHAKVVVDASGQSSMLIDRFGLRQWDQELKKTAIWTYWKGAQRDTGRDEGATLVVQTRGKTGWFWYIPLHDDILSVGIVSSYDYLFKPGAKRSLEEIYQGEVERTPGIANRIASATRATEYITAKEYSYKSKQAAGDGWVLVGDAYGFLDPLYSSGVMLALKSGQLASDAILEGFAKGDWSASQLGNWQTDYDRGMARMRRLVLEYYNGFSFGRFVRRYPQYKGLLTDLLIGDLFKDELDEVFQRIDEVKAEAAAVKTAE